MSQNHQKGFAAFESRQPLPIPGQKYSLQRKSKKEESLRDYNYQDTPDTKGEYVLLAPLNPSSSVSNQQQRTASRRTTFRSLAHESLLKQEGETSKKQKGTYKDQRPRHLSILRRSSIIRRKSYKRAIKRHLAALNITFILYFAFYIFNCIIAIRTDLKISFIAFLGLAVVFYAFSDMCSSTFKLKLDESNLGIFKEKIRSVYIFNITITSLQLVMALVCLVCHFFLEKDEELIKNFFLIFGGVYTALNLPLIFFIGWYCRLQNSIEFLEDYGFDILEKG